MVAAVGDVEGACGVHGDSVWRIETGVAAVGIGGAGKTRATGDRGDRSSGGDFPDGVVARIADEHVSGSIHGKTCGSVETGRAATGISET